MSYSSHGDYTDPDSTEIRFIPDPSPYRVPIPNRFDCSGKIPITFEPQQTMELAGPRKMIFFKPEEVKAAIITCGGLCPGLNDIIHSITKTLRFCYGVKNIIGIRDGYQGFFYDNPVVPLSPEIVKNIHKIGGSFIGISRGKGDEVEKIAQRIIELNINILFIIGGDGTQRGAREISQYFKQRNLPVAIVGVPKTIDNDILLVHKTFGFDTAVSLAVQAVNAATVEASSAPNGIGLVKLMGRDSGFIAAYTAIASQDADFVLIPEVEFDLDPPNGLYAHLQKRLKSNRSAVIIVAEGAGQELFKTGTRKRDLGGNLLYQDIGVFLKNGINQFFEEQNIQINLKYIDPSYMIRAANPIPTDAYYSSRLGAYAVHAAMAGKTCTLISFWNGTFIHIPIEAAVTKRNKINPGSNLWRHVLEATGQKLSMRNT